MLRYLRWIDDHGHAALAVSGLGAVDPDGIGIVNGENKYTTLQYSQSAAPGLVRHRAGRVWYVFAVECRLESRIEASHQGDAADDISVHVISEEIHQPHHARGHSRRRKG